MADQDVDEGGPDSITKDAESTFTCEVCGKTYDNARSLNGHRLSHLKSTTGATKAPKRSRRVEEDGESVEGPKVGYDYDEDEGFEPPDVLEDLEKSLLLFGMNSKDANRFCRMMQSRPVDNVYDLVEIANRLSWRKDKLYLWLEDWTSRRGIRIPDDIADEIEAQYKSMGPTLPSRRGSYNPYGYSPSQQSPAQQMAEMARAFKDLKEVFEPEGNGGGYDESEELSELRLEVEKLKAEKDKLEQKVEFQHMLDEQKKQFEDRIKDLEDKAGSKGWSQRVEDEALDAVKGIRETGRSIKDWLLTSAEVASQAPPPPREGAKDLHSEGDRIMEEEFAKAGLGSYIQDNGTSTPTERLGQSIERNRADENHD